MSLCSCILVLITTYTLLYFSGFTKWSSTREPEEVFELLEALYGAFDRVALKRQVFKGKWFCCCWNSFAVWQCHQRRCSFTYFFLFAPIFVNISSGNNWWLVRLHPVGSTHLKFRGLLVRIFISCRPICFFAATWPAQDCPMLSLITLLEWPNSLGSAWPRWVSFSKSLRGRWAKTREVRDRNTPIKRSLPFLCTQSFRISILWTF